MVLGVFTRLLRGGGGAALGVFWAANRMPGARAIKTRRKTKGFDMRDKRNPRLAEELVGSKRSVSTIRAGEQGGWPEGSGTGILLTPILAVFPCLSLRVTNAGCSISARFWQMWDSTDLDR